MKPADMRSSRVTGLHCRRIAWDVSHHPDIHRMLGDMRTAMSRGHRNDLYIDAESLTSPCVALHVIEVTYEGRVSLRMGARDPLTGLPHPKALKGMATILDCGKDRDLITLIFECEKTTIHHSMPDPIAQCEAGV